MKNETNSSVKKRKTLFVQFKPKYLITSACFALCFTFFLVMGGVIYDRDTFPNLQLLKESGKVFYFSPIIFLLVTGLSLAVLLLAEKKMPEFCFLPKICQNTLAPALLIALWFGVVYLSYFPGTWCYDIIEQNRMVLGIVDVTKHHPPLHTAIWALCHLAEVVTSGHLQAIVVYSIAQIICTSLLFGRVVYSVRKVMKNDICAILTFLFFLLNPTFALFSFSPTKDVWCMIFFVLSMVHVFEYLFVKEEKTNETIARLGVDILLACLFRNNVIYGLVLSGVVFLVLFRKHWKKILALGLIILVGFILVDKVLFGILGFADSDTKEMLSVPIQQIGRTYVDHGDEFTKEELEDYDRYIGLENAPYYCSHLSDPLKLNFNTKEFKKNPGAFVSYWFNLGRKYPDSYFISYASMYSPYWYVRSKSYDVYSASPYVETHTKEDKYYLIQRKGYLPGLNAFFEDIAQKSDNPLLSRGLPLWITVTSLFFTAILKRKKAVLIPIVCFSYFLTLFLGPLCIIRYALPVLAMAPILVFSLFCQNK